MTGTDYSSFPCLDTGDYEVNFAFRIAMGDIFGNLSSCKAGLLEKEETVLLAGLDYHTVWTRDNSINVWNGGGLLFPAIARNTLMSVLESRHGKIHIGGQYWDAIIWCIGAWYYYLYTGNKEFLKLALESVRNSLECFESSEFDPVLKLFRGPACYGDGVSAYPDRYAGTDGSPCILGWPENNPDKKANKGFGIPMFTLSTNCLYYQAYVLFQDMAGELGINIDSSFKEKAEALKTSINNNFWNPEKGLYRYMIDPWGASDFQEGMGHCFAILFGIADEAQRESIFNNIYIAPKGMPCVWPSFDRYKSRGYGRHSGTIWPHIQGFWASAAAICNKTKFFENEFNLLTEHSRRDSQFTEMYHPVTGEIYGGVQESEKGIIEWKSLPRLTWSATAYLRMVLTGLFGMNFKTNGIEFKPFLPVKFKKIILKNLRYRNMSLDIEVDGTGNIVKDFSIDGKSMDSCFLPADNSCKHKISVRVA